MKSRGQSVSIPNLKFLDVKTGYGAEVEVEYVFQ